MDPCPDPDLYIDSDPYADLYIDLDSGLDLVRMSAFAWIATWIPTWK